MSAAGVGTQKKIKGWVGLPESSSKPSLITLSPTRSFREVSQSIRCALSSLLSTCPSLSSFLWDPPSFARSLRSHLARQRKAKEGRLPTCLSLTRPPLPLPPSPRPFFPSAVVPSLPWRCVSSIRDSLCPVAFPPPRVGSARLGHPLDSLDSHSSSLPSFLPASLPPALAKVSPRSNRKKQHATTRTTLTDRSIDRSTDENPNHAPPLDAP